MTKECRRDWSADRSAHEAWCRLYNGDFTSLCCGDRGEFKTEKTRTDYDDRLCHTHSTPHVLCIVQTTQVHQPGEIPLSHWKASVASTSGEHQVRIGHTLT
ncbi:hypothetical protein D9M71_685790 [compost metagenome]